MSDRDPGAAASPLAPAGHVRIRSATRADADTILHLLRQSSLPTDGIVERVDTTLIAHSGMTPVGTAALEIYPSAALLRSVAVDAAARTTGVGTALTTETLSLARQRGVKTVVLLTTTAELFFARFGFERITRDLVPRELKESVEFTSACPASAIVMRVDVPRSGEET